MMDTIYKIFITLLLLQLPHHSFAGKSDIPYPFDPPPGLCKIYLNYGEDEIMSGDSERYVTGTILGNYILTVAHGLDHPIKKIVDLNGYEVEFIRNNRHIHHGYVSYQRHLTAFDVGVIQLKKHYPTIIELPTDHEVDIINTILVKNKSLESMFWFGYGSPDMGLTSGRLGEQFPLFGDPIIVGDYVRTIDKSSFVLPGDSGGPLIYIHNNRYILYALVVGSKNELSLFEKIENYVPWIISRGAIKHRRPSIFRKLFCF